MTAALLLALILTEGQGAGYTISGTVVDAVSGAPLRRARVMLFEAESRRLMGEWTTDESGGFHFEGLPKGKYALEAEKAGYVIQRYGQKALFSTFFSAIATGEGLATEGLRFELIPSSAISGTVVDERGEPVPGILVTCYRQTGHPDNPKWTRYRYEWTNDLGRYRIHSLRKGTYIVVAQGAESLMRELRDGRKWGYAPAFAPGVADAAQAARIRLEPGQEARADIAVRESPLVTVTVTQSGQAPPGPAILTTRFARLSFLHVGTAGVARRSGFTIYDVPRGAYTLLVSSATEPRILAMKQVTVEDEPVTVDVGSETGPGAKITVEWVDGPPKQAVALMLDAEGAIGGQMTRLEPDSTAHFAVLPPGQYVPKLRSGNRDYAVTGMTVRPGRVADGALEIDGSGPVEIRLTAVSGVKDVAGRVFKDGVPLMGATVILLPRNQPIRAATWAVDQSDSDGTFSWKGVAPGEYLAFAFEHGEVFDYADPEVMGPLLRLGQPVTVKPGANPEVRLEATRVE